MYTNMIKEIACRMSCPEKVLKTVLNGNNCNPDPYHPLIKQIAWHDLSLSEGYPALLLLFSQLDLLFPEEKWDLVVHSYMLKIKESIERIGIRSSSLFGGIAGCCFAVGQTSRVRGYYKKLYNSLINFLITEVRAQYFPVFKEHLLNGTPIRPSLYEVIQGLAGIGVCALNDLTHPMLSSFLQEILELLVSLVKPIEIQGKWVPGWYVLPEFNMQEETKLRFPLGNFNLGLSHGITGVLAFLAIAYLHNIQVPRQREAIKHIATWLCSKRKRYKNSSYWEAMIPIDYDFNQETQENFSSRDAWCYGTPGVANTLYLASRALQDEELKKSALTDFQSIFFRTQKEWKIPGPTLCHGIGGLFLITNLLANHSKEKKLFEQKEKLKLMLVDFFNKDHPFGIKDLEPLKNGGFVELDKSGLLEGASGVLLTLLSSEHKISWWHAPFLVGEE